jgi:hypothetical protein
MYPSVFEFYKYFLLCCVYHIILKQVVKFVGIHSWGESQLDFQQN